MANDPYGMRVVDVSDNPELRQARRLSLYGGEEMGRERLAAFERRQRESIKAQIDFNRAQAESKLPPGMTTEEADEYMRREAEKASGVPEGCEFADAMTDAITRERDNPEYIEGAWVYETLADFVGGRPDWLTRIPPGSPAWLAEMVFYRWYPQTKTGKKVFPPVAVTVVWNYRYCYERHMDFDSHDHRLQKIIAVKDALCSRAGVVHLVIPQGAEDDRDLIAALYRSALAGMKSPTP